VALRYSSRQGVRNRERSDRSTATERGEKRSRIVECGVDGLDGTGREFKQAEPKEAQDQVKRIKRVGKPQVGNAVVEGYLTEHSPFKAGSLGGKSRQWQWQRQW
jgi:hypothetical protein